MIKAIDIEHFQLLPLSEKARAFYVKLHGDPYIMQNIATPLTSDKAHKSFDACIKNNSSKRKTRYTWLIRDGNTFENAGICALVLKDDIFKGTSFGIILAKAFHHQGFGMKILAGIMDFGVQEEGVNRYVGYSVLGNEVSYRLMLKLGFNYIKEERNTKRDAGYYWYKDMRSELTIARI